MSLGRDCCALGMTSVKAGGVISVGGAGEWDLHGVVGETIDL